MSGGSGGPAWRSGGCRAGAAAAALLLYGCATTAPYDPSRPALVSLPIAAAQVQDERLRFGSYVQRELDVAAGSGASGVWEFLHRPDRPPTSGARAPLPLPDAAGADLSRVSVLLVPGVFGDCVDKQAVPFGDGLVRAREQSYTAAYAQYADLGLHGIRALQVPGRADSVHNGALIAEQLVAEAQNPEVDSIVLLGYSKGLPDALHALVALQQAGRLSPKVKALVSVAGVVMGTPIADRYLGLYGMVGGLLGVAGCPPALGGEIESLTRDTRSAWLAGALPLPGLAYYSLVAHAPREIVSPGLLSFYDELAEIEPRNDGQVLMSEAILPGSKLIGAARSDHWNFVLPLARHPSYVVRSFISADPFPREALLRALVRYVADDLARR